MQRVPAVQIYGMCVVFVWRHVYDALKYEYKLNKCESINNSTDMQCVSNLLPGHPRLPRRLPPRLVQPGPPASFLPSS